MIPGGREIDEVEEKPKCLEEGPDCQGAVQYRMSLSPTGLSVPRCDKHWSDRLDLDEGLRQRYPEQTPANFDPLYAGETWDDDE